MLDGKGGTASALQTKGRLIPTLPLKIQTGTKVCKQLHMAAWQRKSGSPTQISLCGYDTSHTQETASICIPFCRGKILIVWKGEDGVNVRTS